MSVLNQMLRDLEKRGAMPDLVAAAGTATVARPSLAIPSRKTNLRRRWIWSSVFATGAAFVGVHTWLNERVQQAGGEPALHDEPAELRARGERGIEMQRVAVAGDLRELVDVLGRERQAT